MGCFVVLLTREIALKGQDTQSLSCGDLIWLRHVRVRMGHQIAASPTGGTSIMGGATNRSLLTAYHGRKYGRHARYSSQSSSTPPHPERERHSNADVKKRGW